MNFQNNIFRFFLALLLFLSGYGKAQNNGVYFDAEHSSLIPMMKDNYLLGHVMCSYLDKINKDSNSYAMSLLDDKLNILGQKKLVVQKDFTLGAVIFNGEEIVSQFLSSRGMIRYIYFDQKAEVRFDTTFDFKIIQPREFTFRDLQWVPVYPVTGYGFLQNFVTKKEGRKLFATIYAGNDHKIFVHYHENADERSSIKLLGANDHYAVHARMIPGKEKHRVRYETEIYITSLDGTSHVGSLTIQGNDHSEVFPIQVSFGKNSMELISSFIKQKGSYGKVKFGLCTHEISFNGKLIGEHYNEFTKTLIQDSIAKYHKLLTNSFLYCHLAKKLENNNWLVAFEHLQRTKTKIRLYRNMGIIYNKANIGLIEISPDGTVEKMYVEKTKASGRNLPKEYARSPHLGSFYLKDRQMLDFHYFVENNHSLNEEVSFVYLNHNSSNGKKIIGNLVYTDGNVSSDNYLIPKSEFSYMAILPTRFRHCLLIKYDPVSHYWDIDNIKFNN